MSTHLLMAIGEEARKRIPIVPVDSLALARHLWSIARFQPEPLMQIRCADAPHPTPFATRQFLLGAITYELVCWLPGRRDPAAVWWEDLSVWVLLRRAA
jgi:hypothetical protein